MSLISPNFDVKLIFFPNFGQGPFSKIAGKGPDLPGVTIVAKSDYCNSIDIAGSTIAILLLLWTTIAILL